ncbi:LuxR C-terminal-related transcriptional regulator (plasmid) [Hymenobacter sp. 5317J-9]|uniref:helix-turn-helix transcriptional regulator n=1 Tax=Hymenobacter sp. 5317J-9 TaxID=2932250 RepID=UPI001FD68026|nr:LuxR C-terminal-related transcriptional regulator [Hymenobacter sp. 5317J-9]UOR00206.1 LuxR C-terminal-related transcriptional regulator [Hymenobacter sp. 5317J-9]
MIASPPLIPELAGVRRTWRTVYPYGDHAAPTQLASGAMRELSRQMLLNQFIFIHDVRAQQPVFVSAGIERVLGCPAADFSVEWLYQSIHPDDVAAVGRATVLSAEYAARYRAETMGQVFSTAYRLRHQRGHYVRVLRQNYGLSADEEGNVLLIASVYTDISAHKLTDDVTFHCTDERLQQRLEQELRPPRPRLSHREQAVLQLVLAGRSSREIATELHLSVHTVNTHRRNISRKHRQHYQLGRSVG